MSKKNISQEKIIQAFLASAFDKSAGATSLADVSEGLEIKKAYEQRRMFESSVSP